MTKQAILFDLDGTLVDSIPDLAHAANAMRTSLGMSTLPVSTISHYVGKGMDSLIHRTIHESLDPPETDEKLFTQAKTAFVTHYHAINGKYSTLYKGVSEGLIQLKAQGYTLGVVTNKPEEFTIPLLKLSGLIDFFSIIVSGDSCIKKKPDPMPLLYACEKLGVSPENTVFVGDSMNDVIAAQAAKMPVYVLPYGYNEGKSVQNLNASGIIDSITELSALI